MKNNILVNIICWKLMCYKLPNHINFHRRELFIWRTPSHFALYSLNTVWILYKLALAPWKSARSLKGTAVNNATPHFYFTFIRSRFDRLMQHKILKIFVFNFDNSPAISAEVLQRCPNLFPNCSTFPNPQAHSSSVIFRIFCTVFNQSFIFFGVIELIFVFFIPCIF